MCESVYVRACDFCRNYVDVIDLTEEQPPQNSDSEIDELPDVAISMKPQTTEM